MASIFPLAFLLSPLQDRLQSSISSKCVNRKALYATSRFSLIGLGSAVEDLAIVVVTGLGSNMFLCSSCDQLNALSVLSEDPIADKAATETRSRE
mmetsp:Transcript_14405/g.35116  ORF Transcript_14405/g.35116 Transcript_14405/m.35116 type:complete len:95 (+) Transcript_14405:598-882(+)